MNDLFDRWPGQAPETVGLEIEALEWDTADAVWSAIVALQGSKGWLCRPEQVSEWPGGEPSGPLLSAELVDSDGTTLHVRRVGRTWRGWRYRELPSGDLLRFRQTLLGTVPDSDQRLAYAIYWRLELGLDELCVYRPFTARFTGWEET
ncbi:MAG TPA: hypothetical protein ENK18_28635 [Deltaproteobacteria bacterium]|nr:hypothetical protein [Deltaproteobacteria bacterium]